MSRTVNQLAAPVLDQDDGRWALVLRVAASRQFSRAPQLHDILVYICRRALSDPSACIKEHEIGCDALGRRADFNTNEDNIVRVQISHLRKKLDEYFATDGKDEPLLITVPKGAYMPRFEVRVEPAPAPDAPGETAEPHLAAERRRFPWVTLLAISTGLLAMVCIYLVARPAGSAALSQSPAPMTVRTDPFWTRLFGEGQRTALVVSDSCLVVLQDTLHSDITLAEFLSPRYPEELLNKAPNRELRSALELVASRQYTSLGDLNIASKLAELSLQFGGNRASVRFARHLNIREFKSENFVLIGSRRSIPWVQLFEQQLNFSFEEDKATHRFRIRNKRPKPGEPETFASMESGTTAETYSVVAMLPNLGNSGSVLILSGITMAASEAAGELVVRKDFAQELTRLLGSRAAHEQYFELLVKTRVVGGTSRSSQIVASRLIQPGDGVN